MTEPRTSTFADLGVIESIVERFLKHNISTPFHIQALVFPTPSRAATSSGRPRPAPERPSPSASRWPERLTTAPGDPGSHPRPDPGLSSQVTEGPRSPCAVPGPGILAAYGGDGHGQHIWGRPTRTSSWPRPGRLIDLIKRGAADMSNIHMLVIDEADRMADMGFLPQVARILVPVPRDRQTMLFSATLDGRSWGSSPKQTTRSASRSRTVCPRSNRRAPPVRGPPDGQDRGPRRPPRGPRTA